MSENQVRLVAEPEVTPEEISKVIAWAKDVVDDYLHGDNAPDYLVAAVILHLAEKSGI